MFNRSLNARCAALVLATAVLAGIVMAVGAARAQENQNSDGTGIELLPVQGTVYLLAGAGGNITVQAGKEGVLLVDTGSAQFSDQILAAIRKISEMPLRVIINTSVDPDHVGGNQTIGRTGMVVEGAVVGFNAQDVQRGAQIIAHENTYNRMNGVLGGKTSYPQTAWPSDPFHASPKKLFSNDEGIEIIHVPAAHTDGDSIVFFRRSDVISAGDILDTTRYPVIDIARGGNVQGIIDGLNLILDLTIAKQEVEGGTYVIPGHGRICDQFDVLEYRDMVVIIRDRIENLIKKGKTLEEIKASKPTEDYEARYGANSGSWTTDNFIDAVYKSLLPAK